MREFAALQQGVPRSLSLLEAALPRLDTTVGLIDAALAIAAFDDPSLETSTVHSTIEAIAKEVRLRVPHLCGLRDCERSGTKTEALLAHLHEVLFDEHGFTGAEQDYYEPHNSYLPTVLSTKRGIPVTLALIYKAVADRIGLTVRGVNAPWHFLVSIDLGGTEVFIDPFCDGRMMNRDEAIRRLETIMGRTPPEYLDLLPVATHAQWIARMLQNLQSIFAATNRIDGLTAMVEMRGKLGDRQDRTSTGSFADA